MKEQRRNSREIRSEHNKELIKRMTAGESLQSYDSAASWFPPRPVIAKDEPVMKRLYSAAPRSERPKSDVPRAILALTRQINGDDVKESEATSRKKA